MPSGFTYDYDSVRVRDVQFLIGARHTPGPNDPESFAVILFFQKPDTTRIEVAKVDNSEHEEGDLHVDRYYREVGGEVKDFSVEFENCWEAEHWLEDNAQHFARTYLENHGKQPREDRINV